MQHRVKNMGIIVVYLKGMKYCTSNTYGKESDTSESKSNKMLIIFSTIISRQHKELRILANLKIPGGKKCLKINYLFYLLLFVLCHLRTLSKFNILCAIAFFSAVCRLMRKTFSFQFERPKGLLFFFFFTRTE